MTPENIKRTGDTIRRIRLQGAASLAEFLTPDTILQTLSAITNCWYEAPQMWDQDHQDATIVLTRAYLKMNGFDRKMMDALSNDAMGDDYQRLADLLEWILVNQTTE